MPAASLLREHNDWLVESGGADFDRAALIMVIDKLHE
jgi:hypothetical protein